MPESDLNKFLFKVEQLQELVRSLDHVSGRRELLAACVDHNEVVQLARSWGYEIGKRWGEIEPQNSANHDENLLRRPIPLEGDETKHLIQEGSNWRLELIYSCSACTENGLWFDQEEHEWGLILRGSASLKLKDSDSLIDLSVGDHFYLAPHCLHRVERTDPAPGTTWLVLLWHE